MAGKDYKAIEGRDWEAKALSLGYPRRVGYWAWLIQEGTSDQKWLAEFHGIIKQHDKEILARIHKILDDEEARLGKISCIRPCLSTEEANQNIGSLATVRKIREML